MVQLKKVPKSKKNGCPVENVSYAAPSFRCKEVQVEESKRKLGDEDNTSAKDRGFKVENVSYEAPSLKNMKVPAERSKRKLKDNTDAKERCFKFEIGGST